MPIFHRPGQQLKKFTALRKGTHKNDKGRVSNSEEPKTLGEFEAMIIIASQEEKERWKSIDHPITHQIIQMQGSSDAVAGDYLIMTGNPGRTFYIQGIADPGELGLSTIYSVQEKEGVG